MQQFKIPVSSIVLVSMLLTLTYTLKGQRNVAPVFTHQDTLRGSIGKGRLGWNVTQYELSIQPDFETKTISGKNIIRFMDTGAAIMQIDMQHPMIIDSVINHSKKLSITRENNVYWVTLRETAARDKVTPLQNEITVYFHGKPREAVRPPWDGGWIWRKDKSGNPWMTVACQGLGASVWYPCKDYQGDEPDNGAILHITVPDSLAAVGNGRLTKTEKKSNGTTTYTWVVKNPINNYNLVPYIGKYVHFSEKFKGENGPLDMDYWVIDGNLEVAKNQFQDAPRMMKAFEHWFGPYPFYDDGYKLVESPHLGMEHQSAIAYGNGFKNGYLGRDLSGTGWGTKFDFIIVHESGHEWFANNITTKDIADMWVHEGFTNYSETLFTDYYYGKEAGNDYVVGTRKNVQNDIPIIGRYGVNNEGSGDMYYKAGNMIHILRQIMGDDEHFRKMLIGLNKTFFHKTVTSSEIENYISKFMKKDLSRIFDQYLRTTNIPVLQYKFDNRVLIYRWMNCVDGFNMPVFISINNTGKRFCIAPATSWKKLKLSKKKEISSLEVDRNFYIQSEYIK